MMNKLSTIAAAVVLGGVFTASAVTNDWENPAVNSINRLPARVYTMPLADINAAFTDALEPETPYRKSLNGNWKISWTGDANLRVKGFEAVDYNDADWLTVDVPSCLELRGFGAPGYVNTRFPTANTTHPGDSKENFAKVLDRDTKKGNYNPTASYRTTFTVPADWSGRRVILRFDGVGSAYYVWVNGRKIGYAEDSKLPSEFDVTDALKPSGSNLLAVEVFKWCDGSFLEDQDMFRYSGIFRDVTLWSMPKDGLWDFAVRTFLKNDYKDGVLQIEGIEGDWSAELFDADRKPVARLSSVTGPCDIFNINLWSAEKPYLYTLVVKKGSDIRMRRIGFKEQKIVGHTVFVNGQPVKFKGVNRHESSPDNGRTVSMEDMLRDISLFKRYNINTVRTCHYPDHHSWYDLCDRFGIYVVAEANVEGHEADYGEKGLGRIPEWWHTIIERNERNVVFHRDNPSVVFFSLGNETGHGDGFRKAIASIRKLDPYRLLHWERGNKDVDVDSTMYSSVEWLESRGQIGDGIRGLNDQEKKWYEKDDAGQSPNKAFFMCEYAHAMGNAIGNFKEYWEVFYKYESLSGGCIWDWVDQAVWKYTDRINPRTGRRDRYLAYGGDSDEEPNDGPFCCNGVVDPMRNVSAKLVEVGHVYQNLVVENYTNGVFTLWNRFCFTKADEFDGKWVLYADGDRIAAGSFQVPALKPLSRVRFAVPEFDAALAKADQTKELLVNFEFATKADERWAKRGWVIAKDQLTVSAPRAFEMSVPEGTAKAVEDEKTVTVTAGKTKAVFCRKSGTLCELELDGKTILKDPAPGIAAGPLLTCARAFTDNDRWMRDGNSWCEDRKAGSFMSKGLANLSYHARPIKVEGNKVTIVTEVTGRKSAGFTHTAVYAFGADGSITVKNTAVPFGDFPYAIPRLGLSLKLDRDLEAMEYYGRGPKENYVDRLSGSFLGHWKSTVFEQYENYVRPQDNGCKCDVRWVKFLGSDGKGVKFSASEPMFVQALHNTWEEFDFARHRSGQKRFRTPVVPRAEVCLNLDVRQTGLGGASCGPRPMDKYIYRPTDSVSWTLRIEPSK